MPDKVWNCQFCSINFYEELVSFIEDCLCRGEIIIVWCVVLKHMYVLFLSMIIVTLTITLTITLPLGTTFSAPLIVLIVWVSWLPSALVVSSCQTVSHSWKKLRSHESCIPLKLFTCNTCFVKISVCFNNGYFPLLVRGRHTLRLMRQRGNKTFRIILMCWKRKLYWQFSCLGPGFYSAQTRQTKQTRHA